jgi:hypothetical protein
MKKVDRETEPGFGHTDQVSLAFRLVANFFAAVCIAATASYATARYRS